jgi:hypothetical protein
MLNLSGTGIISFIIGFILYSYIKGLKRILWLIPIAFILIYTINVTGYFEFIENMLANKADSQSGISRSTATDFTFKLFLKTLGIGVGLGSHRGGSFIIDLLASLGIIGTFLFYKIYSYLIKKSFYNQNLWLFNFAIVLMVAQFIAIPDFSFSIMWMCLFMATAMLPQKA